MYSVLGQHPNLVTFLGYCYTPPQFGYIRCIFMEDCRYGALFDILHSEKTKCSTRTSKKDSMSIQLRTVLSKRPMIALGLARALRLLHQSGYAHLDLTSRNVLITEQGEAKLCDFGLSMRLHNGHGLRQPNHGPSYWKAPELSKKRKERQMQHKEKELGEEILAREKKDKEAEEKRQAKENKTQYTNDCNTNKNCKEGDVHEDSSTMNRMLIESMNRESDREGSLNETERNCNKEVDEHADELAKRKRESLEEDDVEMDHGKDGIAEKVELTKKQKTDPNDSTTKKSERGENNDRHTDLSEAEAPQILSDESEHEDEDESDDDRLENDKRMQHNSSFASDVTDTYTEKCKKTHHSKNNWNESSDEDYHYEENTEEEEEEFNEEEEMKSKKKHKINAFLYLE